MTLMKKGTSKLINKYKTYNINTRFFIVYTLIFLVVSYLVFYEFIINHKSLVWIHDGYDQHTKAAVYISQWMRGYLYNIIQKQDFIPETYSFGLGYGGDIVTTLNFYGFGDIIYLPTINMSQHGAMLYHNFINYFRYYLSGLSFYAFFSYTQRENGFRVYQPISGALIYTFCGYALVAGLRHPQFLIPMVMFPLALLGLEKLLREKKPTLFVIIIFLSSMANFILFFMMAILIVVYFFWREISFLGIHKPKKILTDLVTTAIYALLGLVLASVIILPVILMLLNDTRTSKGLDNFFMYSWRQIWGFLEGFLNVNKHENYTFLAYGASGAISVYYLLTNIKKNRKLFWAFITITFFLCLPAFGYLVYGTSYAGNRWVWAYSFLIGYITALYFPKLISISKEKYKKIILAAIIYSLLLCTLDFSISIESAVQLIIIFAGCSIIGLYTDNKKVAAKTAPIFAILMSITSVLGSTYFYTSYKYGNVSADAIDYEVFEDGGEFWATDAATLNDVYSPNSFYRLAGQNLITNGGLFTGVSTTRYFWSTSNKYMNEFRSEIGLSDIHNRIFNYYDLDYRPYLYSLSSVYIYRPSGGKHPYGFYNSTDLMNLDPYYYLLNENALPIGYGYKNVMSRDCANKEDAATKEKLMMKTAIVENNSIDKLNNILNNDLSSYNLSEIKEFPYREVCASDDISVVGNKIITTATNTTLSLEINNAINPTLLGDEQANYLEITGISFKGNSAFDVYKGNDKKYDPNSIYGKDEWKELSTKTRRDMVRNAIYYTEPENTTVTIVFHYSDNYQVKQPLELHSKNSPWGTDNNYFIINSGLAEGRRLESIDINFPRIGTYTVDQFRIIGTSLDGFVEDVNDLKTRTVSDVQLNKNIISYATKNITAKYNTNEDTFLCFSIPYEKGWKIYVDGQEQELVRANIAYMGTYIEAGNHNIELQFETPGLKAGLLLTIIGVILFIALQVKIKFVTKKESSTEISIEDSESDNLNN